MPAKLQELIPVLMVRDVSASLVFYCRLGFAEIFRDDPSTPRYAAVRRDDVVLHLQWHDAAEWIPGLDRPNYRFLVPQVDDLYAEFSRANLTIAATPPRETPWKTREFHLCDPDNNGLQFFRPL